VENLKKYLKVFLQIAILVITFYFLGRTIVDDWQALRAHQWRLELSQLIVSFLLLLVATAFPAWPWQLSLLWMGESLGFVPALRIWLVTHVVRYIPGRVWQFLSMIYMCERAGVSRVPILTSIVISAALSTLAGLLIVGLYWLALNGWQDLTQLSLALALILLSLAALHPAVMERVLNRGLAFLGQPTISLQLSFGHILLLLALNGLSWLLYGLAFQQLVAAITFFPLAELPRAVAVFAGAYTIGYLSLLTPAGLGVREGAMVVLFGSALPLPLATVVSLAARLWLTLGEVLGAGVLMLWPDRPPYEVEHGS
jgi:hypothetical protein